ncbi:MAG: hypothetical protein R3D58_13150 [Saprospiraceae bacterium]
MKMYKAIDYFFPNWNALFSEEVEIGLGIDALKMLIDSQEKSWDAINKKLDDAIKNDEFLNGLDDELKGSYFTQIYEYELMMLSKLKMAQRHFSCLSIFSFFEGRLKALYTKIENEHNLNPILNNRPGISDYWGYLTKQYKIDKNEIEPLYTPIKQQQFVRNCIAHNDSYFSKKDINEIFLMNGLRTITVGEFYQLEIYSSDYLLNLLDKMSTFFNKLLRAIDDRYKEIKIENGL